MRRLKFIAAAAVTAWAIPLNTSAAVRNDMPADGLKAQSYSGFSVSVPRFRLSGESGGEPEISLDMGRITRAPDVYGKADELPSSYDMRKVSGVSSVKNQGSEGTCWAHSAIASAESSIIGSVPDADLSEYHTAYYVYFGDDQIPNSAESVDAVIDTGGTILGAANLWSQWIGPVREALLPYGDTDFFKDTAAVEAMKHYSDYHLKNAYLFDFAKDRSNADEINSIIKQFVYGGQAVDISFQADMKKYSKEHNSIRSVRKPKYANHSVTVIGWDDSFPKENFVEPAECDGAWLVKNSWGMNKFEGGCMWISYDDRSLCELGAFELCDSSDYTVNFHHDTFAPIQSMSAHDSGESGASYMANVFTADSEIQLDAVSTYMVSPGTDYEIAIYSGLTDDTDPTSGRLRSLTKGTSDMGGVVEIELEQSAVVGRGDVFSVVMKLENPDNAYVIPIESAMWIDTGDPEAPINLGSYCHYDRLKAHTGEHESFFSGDGESWTDTISEDYTYTEEEKEEILEQLKEELFDDIYPDEKDLLKKAETTYNTYVKMFEGRDVNISIGNVSLKVLGRPVNSVSFSRMSGIVKKSDEIELSVKTGDTIYYSVNGGSFEKYTAPIKPDGFTLITATTDFENVTKKSYIPAGTVLRTGDVDCDGKVDATDASTVLGHYAELSTGGTGTICSALLKYADCTGDGRIDASDASEILKIYADNSTK